MAFQGSPGLIGTARDLSASKVPEATLLFWTIKVLTTGMGETTSDFLVGAMNPKVAVLLGLGALIASLAVQLFARRFHPWIYWLAVLMVAVFGTMAADVTHVVLGVPYLVSSVAFAVALGLAFWLWHAAERTLSVHSITTPRREVFYWAVVLLTFALGTALGDLSAHGLSIGYFGSALVYGALILVPLGLFRTGRLGEVAAFWSAYVMTRPLGASLADAFGAPAPRGGLGLGFGPVSLVLAVAFVLLVARAAREEDAIPA